MRYDRAMIVRKHSGVCRWLLVRFRGRSAKGGMLFEQRVIRYGFRLDTRKDGYASLIELRVRPLRRCVWALHQHA